MIKNLKYLRTKHRLSQLQLAEIIGISQQSVNKYENHSVEPGIDILIKLADYFDTSVDYLIGNTELDRRIEATHRLDLNDDETTLVELYRSMSVAQRKGLIVFISSIIE